MRVVTANNDDQICPPDTLTRFGLPTSRCVLDRPIVDKERRPVVSRLPDKKILEILIVIVIEANENSAPAALRHARTPR
jgi:hypothetical protein